MARKKASPQQQVARAVVQRLESLQRAGVTHMKKPKRSPAASKSVASKSAKLAPSSSGATPRKASAPAPTATATPPVPKEPLQPACPAAVVSAAEREAALAVVQRKVAACVRCAELAQTRTQTVFGVGNPCARLAFLGEAPGADEDRTGIPFVGRAGQLLTDIIEKGMQISRSDVYILNILRCRPPGNRTPLPHEAANCREWLDAQLEIIRPQFICCLGAVAAQNLLATTESIGKLRGRFFNVGDIRVMCTYHPAYVLRNPPAKRQVWEDIQMLMAEMGLEGGKQ